MHVETLDLTDLFGIMIMILGRTVLAEGSDPLIGSDSQHSATSGSLRAHNLAPIAVSVRCKSFAVPGLARTIAIRQRPSREVQVP
jgi:hypothetical protein